jgi:hypothetical protein
MRNLIVLGLCGMAIFGTGCLEDSSGGTTPAHDTLTVHDTVRVPIHDTVVPPFGSCGIHVPAPSDSLVGDFAPLEVGNEWVYQDTARFWSSNAFSSGATSRSGTVTLRLLQSLCKENHLEHTLRLGFEGKYWQSESMNGSLTKDTAWSDSHEAYLFCSDDGIQISCGGPTDLDERYTGFFSFHQVRASDLSMGVDPITGQSVAKALYGSTGNGQIWKGVGTIEREEALSYGATCCGGGSYFKSSLLRFNGISAIHR